MATEIEQVEHGLRMAFASASNIYVDTNTSECEVFISVDDFQGEIDSTIYTEGVYLKMVDYCDTYPYKYIFNYSLKRNKSQIQD